MARPRDLPILYGARREGTTEPGEVVVGRWAHLKWIKRQHLVVADEPEIDSVEPVRLACGRRVQRFRVWHDPPLPHLRRCVACERASVSQAATLGL